MPCYVKSLQSQSYELCTSMPWPLVEKILSHLLSAHVITRYEFDIIQSKTVTFQKTSELLTAITRKGQKACMIFYKALQDCDPSLNAQLTGKQVQPFNFKKEDDFVPAPVTGGNTVNYSITIYNSQLNGCIFGNDSTLSIMKQEAEDTKDQSLPAKQYATHPQAYRNSSQALKPPLLPPPPPPPPPQTDIKIIDSRAEFVIIGDNSTMEVKETIAEEDTDNEQTEPEETEDD
ncbi:uncharacterized protein si:dkey-29h14.10 [Polypterus senegalus]|uniref:uncharacterized protein si:dkey-29h14.10 n=1 Tax=Polypterus senegalus TaxID=55291 RepID=UPI0019628550|nr:uncharacterized protein si:dkey-29h14.10 [Polypterus senegalus]